MSSFIDRFSAECQRAGAAALAPTPAARATLRRSGTRRIRPRRLAAAAAMLAVLAGGGALAATTLAPSTTPPGPGEPRALTITPDASAAFGILRRPATAGDVIPPSASVSFSGASGANPQLARRAAGLTGSEGWVIPGRGSTCIIVNSLTDDLGGAACNPDASATTGEMLLEARARDVPGTTFVAGLVPDDAHSVLLNLTSGQSTTVQVHENLYAAEVHGGLKSAFLITPAGKLLVGRSALGQRCPHTTCTKSGATLGPASANAIHH